MRQKAIICIAAAAIALNAAALIEGHRDELPALKLPSMDAPPPTVEERIVTGVCTFGDCPVEVLQTTYMSLANSTQPETEPEPETEPLTAPEPVPIAPEAPEEPVWQDGRTVTCWVTAYCGCDSCSEGWGSMTATGVYAQPYHTIAVDPSVIPYGTQVEINGTVYTAEDCGGGVNGYSIDVFFAEHWQCEAWPTGYYPVTIY